MVAIRGVRCWLVRLSIISALGCGAQPAPSPGWTDVCIDSDEDGYGFQCSAGPDCDDGDPEQHDRCEVSCRAPRAGCACDATAAPVDCELPYELTSTGALLCNTGTRYCRDGSWTQCEGVKSFTVPGASHILRRAILNADAGAITCSPCKPDCYRVDDAITLPDGGTSGALASGPSGGITLQLEQQDAGVPDAGLLDDVSCTPGVAPDIEVFDDPTLIQAGREPMLEAAVAHLLAELEHEGPRPRPATPDGPDRSR